MSRVVRSSGPVSVHRCGECAHVRVMMEFRTLSVKGEPTLGRCPYYEGGRYCVLLSQRSCEHFKERE